MEQENTSSDVIANPSDAVSIEQAEPVSDASSAQNDVSTDLGEDGVSFKNRYFELERKYQNLSKSIPQMIQEAAQQSAQQVSQVVRQQEPQYSLNDYINAKLRDPQNSAYYDTKIAELQEKKIQDAVTQKLTEFEAKRQQETARQDAERWATTNFPQLRDPNNAFSQAVWQAFNSRPADKREPYDFALAAEVVANRMGIKPATSVNVQQDKLVQKEREVKKLLKERAIEGDGRGRGNMPAVTNRQADMKTALETGDIRGYITKHWLKPATAE